MSRYTKHFFEKQPDITASSAKAIIPLVTDLLHPKSVIDMGCGVGVWLAEFLDQGTERVVGVDGAWLPLEQLLIPKENFVAHNLETPFVAKERFDLVISLEVAEHLAPEAATTFVESLVSLGDVVLFSAAIPFQGGEHHINEQWQQYWADLFREKGFEVFDCVRSLIWDREDVAPFYKQNTLLFIRSSAVNRFPRVQEAQKNAMPVLSVVHPDYLDPTKISLKRYLEKLVLVVGAFFERKMKRIKR